MPLKAKKTTNKKIFFFLGGGGQGKTVPMGAEPDNRGIAPKLGQSPITLVKPRGVYSCKNKFSKIGFTPPP